jgi:holo-[acyl-carrier protein] synthase
VSAPPRVGIDIVSVARIRRVFDRGSDARLRAVFTTSEIADCRAQPRPFESLAARFAAKEGFAKAIGGAGGEAWRACDVVIALDEHGAPRLEVRGGAARVLGALGLARVALSLSHEREYAVASVLLT